VEAKMFRLSLIVLSLFFTSLSSYADETQANEIPPQRQLRLLKATNKDDFYILLTKDAAQEDYMGGNHNVLISDNSRLLIPGPNLSNPGAIYNDGAVDMNLNGGLKLLLPNKAGSIFVGFIGQAIDPMLISEDKAPVKLKEIKMTSNLLNQLGFSNYLAPKKAKTRNAPVERERRPEDTDLVKPETAQIFTISLDEEKVRRDYAYIENLKNQINKIAPGNIKTTERVYDSNYYSSGSSISIVMTEVDAFLPKLKELIKAEGLTVSKLDQNSIAEIASYYREQLAQAKDAQSKRSAAENIYKSLASLAQMYIAINYIAQYETAKILIKKGIDEAWVGSYKNDIAKKDYPLDARALKPIRDLARYGFGVLDQIDSAEARELIVSLATTFDNAAIDVYSKKAYNTNKIYFDIWLDFMRSDLSFIDQLTFPATWDSKPKDVRLSSSSGGIFDNFKVSGDLTGVGARGIIPHIMETRNFGPLIVLGLPGPKEHYKTSILQYIIDADKKAEKLVKWTNEADKARGNTSTFKSFDVTGVKNVTDMISRLAWSARFELAVDGYSSLEAQITALELYNTLIDIAPTSLRTTATIAAIVDGATELLKNINNYGDKEIKQSKKLNAEKAKLENRLRWFLQDKIQSLAYHAKNDGEISACESLLAPNTSREARRKAGY
jgi:hypothetical protein